MNKTTHKRLDAIEHKAAGAGALYVFFQDNDNPNIYRDSSGYFGEDKGEPLTREQIHAAYPNPNNTLIFVDYYQAAEL